ncbi:hypothetical protein KEM54_005147 [Ascosphaera aggregata]|nr:hypothetical protein KEM54_005147 [Ascosphaera aggregata]
MSSLDTRADNGAQKANSGVQSAAADGGQGAGHKSALQELTRQVRSEEAVEQGKTNENPSPGNSAQNSTGESSESSQDTALREKRRKSRAHEDEGISGLFSSHFPWIHRRKKPSGNEKNQGSIEEFSDSLDVSASLEQVVSQMFGPRRKEQSEGYHTLHRGIIWRDLRVYGSGLGTAYQRTNLDALLSVPRTIWDLLTFWRWRQRMRAQTKTVAILHGFSGCVRPGEMMLVLGRPGAGCTTLLRTLGNQRTGYSKVDGTVTYGGTDATEMAKHYRSEVIYNPEHDSHCAALSVRRVLSFAISTRTPSASSRLEGESRSQYRNTFLRAVSKLFWIEGVLDTKIGNNIIRGISGGEKRRVSIAETMVTRSSTQCWDNSTRGLDASTAMEYVASLRSMTDHSQCSTIVSLYQASENLFKQFDKVMVINAGRCAFFGKATDAKAYFEGLGFECPPRWTTPDFVTAVSDVNARRIKKGWEDRIPRSPEDFEQAYNQSSIREAATKDMEEFEQYLSEESGSIRTRDERAKKMRRNYTLPIYHQALLLTKQQFFILIGNRVTLLCKWLIVFFLAWIVGSLFYDLPLTTDGLFTRGGVLFYIILFNCLMAMAELSASFEYRPIIQKHKVL